MMEFYEMAVIFLLGIMVAFALSYVLNEPIQALVNSFRTIPVFDRRSVPERRTIADRRNRPRGVDDRRQEFRRKTDSLYR